MPCILSLPTKDRHRRLYEGKERANQAASGQRSEVADSELNPSSRNHRPASSGQIAGENTLLWTVWFTYGAFYFCRTNISAAVPGLMESVESGGLGLTATQVSYILLATKIA